MNKVLITGGAGFVGTALIRKLIRKYKNIEIVSIDNYSSGYKRNHVKSKKVKYFNKDTQTLIPKKFVVDGTKMDYADSFEPDVVFHFGEFSRIFQSFLHMDECIESNTIGTVAVFNFCLKNKIKLIYSATSASLGNRGRDKNLSPYSFTKSKNIEFLGNLKKWFKFKYEIIFFYNVYGPRQITIGKMATVIGIFEDHYIKGKPLPVVKPGTQSRRFTHIKDTIEVCYKAWKVNKCRYYSISNNKSLSIKEVAKLFNSKIKYLPPRKGERYASALSGMSLNNKVYKNLGKVQLKDYIFEFIKKHT